MKLSHADRLKRHSKAKRTGIVACVEEVEATEEAAKAALVLSLVKERRFVCMDISEAMQLR